MAKAFMNITSCLFLSSILAAGSLAVSASSWPDGSGLDQKDKKKEKEPVPEKQKGGGDRGGKGDDKKDDKKGGKKP